MAEPSLASRLQTASTDLTSLSRVSHRLALVDDASKLQQVLDKLLPRLLHRIGENHQAQQKSDKAIEASLRDALAKIHAKLVEMLSHVMKRVREDQSVQLNCKDIVQLLLVVNDDTSTASTTDTATDDESASCNIPKPKEKVDPFTLNLTLAFLTLGLPRCTKDQLQEFLPGLLVLVGYHSGKVETLLSVSLKSQWHQLTHLLLKAMESIMALEEEQMKKTPSSANKKQKQQSSTTDTTETSSTTTIAKDEDALELTRRVLQQDTRAAGACYNLLLDVLLYQTVAGNSNVPPGGLSQAAHERLKGGHSALARDWAAEMAVRSRLCQLKNRILDWIAPSRKWGLFLCTGSNNKDDDTHTNHLGMARTVALLVAASGDPTMEVSQRASTYLKQHFDNYRNHPERAFGDCMALVADLLRLCVGNTATRGAKASEIPYLGLPAPESSPEHPHFQLALQFQRRAVSEMTFGASATFCSKTMDDTPQLITVETVEHLGTLSVLTSSRILGNLRTASGLTLLRGKPFIAAAQLLNSVVVRVSSLQRGASASGTVMTDLLSKSLATACSVLSLVSTPRSTTGATTTSSTTSEGNVAVRDALYGVVCALSRSSLAEEGTWLFGAGQASSTSTNVETASLLFGCAANEEETLRPRAVAALDALLAAYCRAYITQPATTTPKVETTTVDDNPWSQVATTVAPTDDSVRRQQRELATTLLPLIWTASQHSASKQARVAAARWSSDLMKELDLPNACHLLCFLAGDPDVTASSIAKQGLGLDAEGAVLPDFAELTTLIFYENSNASYGWRPRYNDFSPQGKATAIRFSLQCLLNDLYGGEDEAVQFFVAAITKTLGQVAHFGREYFELSDECATCLSTCLSTSSFARSLLGTKKTSLGLSDLEDLALSASSSRARRHLAESCGHLYEDLSLWESQDWISAIRRPMGICAAEIVNSTSIRLHGAAFLGATCVRAFRLHPSDSVDTCWDLACKILQALGDGTLNPDEIISNSFADGLAIALSYSADDAPILDERLYAGTTAALVKLATSLRKYGNGDHADATRTTKLAHAAGICLASSTSGAGSTGSNLGAARLDCVEALFSLLGSTAFRKDEEIALITGEALACYADAYSPKDVVWSSQSSNWPDDLNEDFAKELPPHQQVSFFGIFRV
jgi:proteasome component ECM29